MALTMTRTRTQTTLTKLAEMVANVHGELEFLDGLLAGTELGPGMTQEGQTRLAARLQKLTSDREALYATIRQFDNRIDPERIGSAQEWRKTFGRICVGSSLLELRYLRALSTFI